LHAPRAPLRNLAKSVSWIVKAPVPSTEAGIIAAVRRDPERVLEGLSTNYAGAVSRLVSRQLRETGTKPNIELAQELEKQAKAQHLHESHLNSSTAHSFVQEGSGRRKPKAVVVAEMPVTQQKPVFFPCFDCEPAYGCEMLEVNIGKSDHNEKTIENDAVSMCAEDSGDPWYRKYDRHFSDTFKIKVAGNRVTARRTDQERGWTVDLVILCVQNCPTTCDEKLHGNGEDYRGCQARTMSGHDCMRWTDPRASPYLNEIAAGENPGTLARAKASALILSAGTLTARPALGVTSASTTRTRRSSE
jgi:hypothetical protein